MIGMKSRKPLRTVPEQLISALVPAPIPRPRPSPTRLPVLPARRLPTGPDALVLDMARLDRSGRLSARALLRALGWRPGHHVDIDVVDGAIVIVSAATGRQAVGAHGELALPTTARQLCGMVPRSAVVLAAHPSLDLVVIHPASTVARLLGEFHARLAEVPNAR
jgi:bifunctional DNA-binding transcriptional regulator/antitoxin component of YhaV-PrlF toxin-antitoxin module